MFCPHDWCGVCIYVPCACAAYLAVIRELLVHVHDIVHNSLIVLLCCAIYSNMLLLIVQIPVCWHVSLGWILAYKKFNIAKPVVESRYRKNYHDYNVIIKYL